MKRYFANEGLHVFPVGVEIFLVELGNTTGEGQEYVFKNEDGMHQILIESEFTVEGDE